MTQGVIRGLFGACRVPILALLAGVGFFMPAAPDHTHPSADDGLRPWTEAPAVLAGTVIVPGVVVERVPGRGPTPGGGSPRQPLFGGSPLPPHFPSVPATGAERGHGADAVARLARAGRLSAPTTAPPPIPS